MRLGRYRLGGQLRRGDQEGRGSVRVSSPSRAHRAEGDMDCEPISKLGPQSITVESETRLNEGQGFLLTAPLENAPNNEVVHSNLQVLGRVLVGVPHHLYLEDPSIPALALEEQAFLPGKAPGGPIASESGEQERGSSGWKGERWRRG
jgi:hypothetical protein